MIVSQKEVKRAAKMLYNALWAPIYLAEQTDGDGEHLVIQRYLDLRNLLAEVFPEFKDEPKRKRRVKSR